MITRDEALYLLKEHVKAGNLLQHCYAVEAGMRSYALRQAQGKPLGVEVLSEEETKNLVETWGIVGLLHDIDYEEFPEEHPSFRVREWLSARDLPEDVIRAIENHGKPAGVRTELIDKALHAVDSISGIIIASALVRPEKLGGMKPKSVSKKIKDKSFAAKMDRERMRVGCEELGVEMSDHLALMIEALQGIQETLGL